MIDARFTPAALTLLDTLYALDTHMGVMRRRLIVMTGVDFSAKEVRDAALRFRDPPAKIRARQFAYWAEKAVVALPVLPQNLDNPVRRIPPGTYPARGFSMLGGRTR